MKIDKLIDEWEDYVRVNDLAFGNFGEKEIEDYQKLMIRTYIVLDEILKSENYDMKVCNLFSKISKFGIKGWDDDGNCTNTRLYEIVSTFHYFFIFDFFEYDGFMYNDEGKLVIIGIDLEEIFIDTDTFDIIGIDGIEKLLGINQ